MNASLHLGHPPFFRLDGSPAPELVDRYSGRPAVLICGGPSFARVDPAIIHASGFVTMTLNNSVRSFRSDLWLGTDQPAGFDRTIWKDPSITKVVRSGLTKYRQVRRGVEVYLFRRSPTWNTEQMFAPGNRLEWPNFRGSGYQTSMMEALRVLFLLGSRTIYLFGVDFHQNSDYGYHHKAKRTDRSIAGNNRIYKNLALRFEMMRPLFEAAGLRVINCNPDSHLDAFEKGEFPSVTAE